MKYGILSVWAFVLVVLLCLLISCYKDEIDHFIIKHFPFNANRLYKTFVKRERKQIRATILNKQSSSSYIRLYIEYKENIKWLQRKGFNVTNKPNCNCTYIISWEDC